MASTIKLQPDTPAARVHLMPFGLEHDVPHANTDEFWLPEPLQDAVEPQQGEGAHAPAAASSSDAAGGSADGLLAAQFRGRRLRGAAKQLPEGYMGLVLRPVGAAAGSSSDAVQRSWVAAQTFAQLTVWNHDTLPAPGDWHVRCVDWLALADKVHAPIRPEDVDQEMRQQQQQAAAGDSS